jgi:hypothetical protein
MLQVGATGIEEENFFFLAVCFYKFLSINEIIYHVGMITVLGA